MCSCGSAWQLAHVIIVLTHSYHGYMLPHGVLMCVGRGGPDCELCDVGTYSAGGSRNPCMSCPNDLTTLAKGSMSSGACTCLPGYGQLTPGANCTVCPARKWSNPLPSSGTPDRSCQDCPENFISPPGSTSINQCGKSPSVATNLAAKQAIAVVAPRCGARRHSRLCGMQAQTRSLCTCIPCATCAFVSAVCASGRFGASCQQECLAGSWCADGKITRCPSGMKSSAGATSEAECGEAHCAPAATRAMELDLLQQPSSFDCPDCPC